MAVIISGRFWILTFKASLKRVARSSACGFVVEVAGTGVLGAW